jgi:hypothetical protein
MEEDTINHTTNHMEEDTIKDINNQPIMVTNNKKDIHMDKAVVVQEQ